MIGGSDAEVHVPLPVEVAGRGTLDRALTEWEARLGAEVLTLDIVMFKIKEGWCSCVVDYLIAMLQSTFLEE